MTGTSKMRESACDGAMSESDRGAGQDVPHSRDGGPVSCGATARSQVMDAVRGRRAVPPFHAATEVRCTSVP